MMENIDKAFLQPADSAAREEMRRVLAHAPRITSARIGRSILGEDIEVYYIGKGRVRVAYFAAHHAAESITCNLLFAFMHALLTDSVDLKGTARGALLRAFSFAFIPCVNPDGIELRLHGVGSSPLADRQQRMADSFDTWQANGRGVDLNHNYDFGFYEYKRLESELGIAPGATRYSGEYPESEPESAACANFVRVFSPSAVVSLHSQGEELFYSPRDRRTGRIAERLSKILGYGIAAPEGCAEYGGLCDYTGALGIPSFTLEVGRGKNPLSEGCIPGIAPSLFSALALLPTVL